MIKKVLVGLLFLAGVAGCSAEQAAPARPVAAEQPAAVEQSVEHGIVTRTPKPVPTITVSAKVRRTVPKSCWKITGACVDLSADRAWLLKKGRIVRGPVPTTHGRPGHPTPTGIFKVEWQKELDHSKTYNDAPMPWATYFAPGGIAFHEGSLAQTSHGCIHLSGVAAKAFYRFLQPGFPVHVVA